MSPLVAALALVLAVDAGAPRPDAGSATAGDGASARELLEAEVIPPGQEKVVLAMLGGSDLLPDGCRLESAEINGAEVEALWLCAHGARVEGKLAAATVPGAPVVQTKKFRLFSTGPTAWPSGLAPAVGARIRAHEGAFTWKVAVTRVEAGDSGDQRPVAGAVNGGQDTPAPRRPVSSGVARPVAIGVILAALFLGWWGFSRERES